MAEYAALCRDLAQMPNLPELGVHSTIRALSCGARTRKDVPCKRTDLGPSGRCRFHGGASTGPRTEAGIERARANLSLRWDRPSLLVGDRLREIPQDNGSTAERKVGGGA